MTITPDPVFGTPPSLPYAGTTGHAGGASGERAVREANDGTAQDRQARIMALLRDAGPLGMTADELQQRNVAPHRSAVSAHTSSLHKAGRIACLVARRNGAGIYVLPEHVAGRQTRAFAGKSASPVEGGPVTSMRDVQDRLAEAQAEIKRLRGIGLTDDEHALVRQIVDWLDRHRRIDTVPLKRATVETLIEIARRADGQQ